MLRATGEPRTPGWRTKYSLSSVSAANHDSVVVVVVGRARVSSATSARVGNIPGRERAHVIIRKVAIAVALGGGASSTVRCASSVIAARGGDGKIGESYGKSRERGMQSNAPGTGARATIIASLLQ